MSEKKCKYPDCTNYIAEAKTYCCNGCSWDHKDYIRLGLDKKKENK